MTILEWRDADNVWAVFAIPTSPYYNVVRVLFWALKCIEDEADELVGLVSSPARIVPVTWYPEGEFCDYLRLDKDPELLRTAIFYAAAKRGIELEAQQTPAVAGASIADFSIANPITPED